MYELKHAHSQNIYIHKKPLQIQFPTQLLPLSALTKNDNGLLNKTFYQRTLSSNLTKHL